MANLLVKGMIDSAIAEGKQRLQKLDLNSNKIPDIVEAQNLLEKVQPLLHKISDDIDFKVVAHDFAAKYAKDKPEAAKDIEALGAILETLLALVPAPKQ